jgi:hypothetical protein
MLTWPRLGGTPLVFFKNVENTEPVRFISGVVALEHKRKAVQRLATFFWLFRISSITPLSAASMFEEFVE